jgi:hypothetical protein
MDASGLKRAQPGPPVDFTDKVMVAVRGYWPQQPAQKSPAVVVCLYDKETGRAEAKRPPPPVG